MSALLAMVDTLTIWEKERERERGGRFSLSIGVKITMIRCVVYLLQIFKMFYGLMNNPVLINK
jgi:hypothetical protein